MRPDIRALRRESRDRANRARAVSRLVAGDLFEAAYSAVGDDDVTAMVRAFDREGIERWLRAQPDSPDLGSLSVNQLRLIGSKLGVRSYNRLPKASLLSEIVNAKRS